jgi:hypothetical protein
MQQRLRMDSWAHRAFGLFREFWTLVRFGESFRRSKIFSSCDDECLAWTDLWSAV